MKSKKVRIGVVGLLGVGKTSLCDILAKQWKIRKVGEIFKRNPFLENFYDDPQRYSFPSQIWFYENRVKQIMSFKKYKKAIIDNDLISNKLFALSQFKMGWMNKDEHSLYKRICD
ncbi:deoxynucleoside kinase, partial [Patescibacteria group bacterium]